MKNLNLTKNVKSLLVFSILIIITACSDDNITEPSMLVGDVFLIDTLELNIYYDETPGFPYPKMNYDIKSVVSLTEDGIISSYAFTCEADNIGRIISIDYFRPLEVGYKFRFDMNFWSRNLIKPGTSVQSSFSLHAALKNDFKNYVVKLNTVVKHKTNGVKPEQNAVQLTGPEGGNYSPFYSSDGNWIYFSNSYETKRTINRMPASGGTREIIENFQDTEFSVGSFTLIDNDSKLVYVLWKPNQYSRIVIKDLTSGNKTEYPINGYLWDSELIHIPNSNKFIVFSDPNSSINYNQYGHYLLTVDILSNKIDTMAGGPEDYINDYSLNPVNGNLYYTSEILYPKYRITKIDLSTYKKSVFIDEIYGYNFKWAPNGKDFAIYKLEADNKDYNIYLVENGIEKQITTYPGSEESFNFSPDGNSMVFSALRREETQVWKIDL